MVAQVVGLDTVVGCQRYVPNYWSIPLALHVSFQVVDLAAAARAVVATSFHLYAAETRLAFVGLPSVVEEEAVKASSVEDG